MLDHLGRRAARAGALGAAISAVLATSAAAADPPSPIAHISDATGDREIHLVLPDGSGSQRVIELAGSDSLPTWTADGTRLAWVHDGDIWSAGADGSAAAVLVDLPGAVNNPAFLPDGRVAFDANTATGRRIHVAEADGTGATPIGPSNAFEPAPSPDGTSYLARVDGVVQRFDADGTNLRKVSMDGAVSFNPAWTPDGLHIVYAANPGGVTNVYSANPDGTGTSQVTPDGGGVPTVSADGTQVAFQKDGDIWVVPFGGGTATKVTTSGATEGEPAWQPALAVKDAPLSPGRRQALIETAAQEVREHPAETKYGADQTLRPTDVARTSSGMTHVRFERLYKGLAVIGGDVVAHIDHKGDWEPATLNLRQAPSLSTTPLIPAVLAQVLAETHLLLQGWLGDLLPIGTGEKIVYAAGGTTPRLAWRITIKGRPLPTNNPEGISQYDVIVDARTGVVIETVAGQQGGPTHIHADGWQGQGLAAWFFGVDQSFRDCCSAAWIPPTPVAVWDEGNGTFTLFDDTRGRNQVLDARLNANPGDDVRISRSTYLKNRTYDGQTHYRGVDAMRALTTIYDLMKNRYGFAGHRGTGAGMTLRIGYRDAATPSSRAFYHRTTDDISIGESTSSGHLTSPDIVGHEWAHGWIRWTSDLWYSGESGGINEAVADMFAVKLELEMSTGSQGAYHQDWTFGEGHFPPSLRNLVRPSLNGNPDCYHGQIGRSDVHRSSGPAGKWFYILAQDLASAAGTTPPTCGVSATRTDTGIGISNAHAVVVAATRFYMSATGGYVAFKNATLNTTLARANPTWATQIQRAWTLTGLP